MKGYSTPERESQQRDQELHKQESTRVIKNKAKKTKRYNKK